MDQPAKDVFRNRLGTVLLHYDMKQEKKKGYNRYALGIYLQAADRVMEDIESGMTPRDALARNFLDRLQAYVLKEMEKAKQI